jgi:hypothetical protein
MILIRWCGNEKRPDRQINRYTDRQTDREFHSQNTTKGPMVSLKLLVSVWKQWKFGVRASRNEVARVGREGRS